MHQLIELLLIKSFCTALLELLESTEPNSGDTEHVLDSNVNAAAADVQAVLDVPMVSTPAGPVPGILILRQNKKRKSTYCPKDISY